MNYGRSHLIEKFCKIQLTPVVSKELDKIFINICDTLDKEPKFIAHRDYHSRNLMLKLGQMRVIDFQDARLGPIQYDLVSLLKDSYVDLDPSIATELIQYYLEKRNQFENSKISKSHFDEIYEIQSIQRCFKACGSFSSFYNTRTDIRYLKYLQATLKRVKKSLDLFPQYKVFSEILEQHKLLERDYTNL